jgi:uncharacterized protein
MIAVSWMFFVEPNIINIKEVNIPMGINKSVVLVSDIHFSKLKNTNFATQVSTKINSIQGVDMVLWAGDWAENLTNEEMETPIKQIGAIKYPQYSVLGNHDYIYKKSAKPDSIAEPTEYSNKLTQTLENNGIRVIDNQSISLSDVELIGISSQSTSYSTYSNNDKNSKKIYLAHEGDAVDKISQGVNQITLSGHSHCGQIKLPLIGQWLYNNFGAHKSKFYEGLYEIENKGRLFINCGLGETILPLRFLNPPTIYKINLN